MAQKYENKYIGLVRSTSSAAWEGYTAGGSGIVESTSAPTMQSDILIDYSDGNHEIYDECTLIADATLHTTYDTSYVPVSGDLTYTNFFIALVKATASSAWETYTGSGSVIVKATDKVTFLSNLRAEYGDGMYRIFQQAVETHTHGYVTVP